MFDVGRVLALVVALVWCARARTRLGAAVVLLVAYVYALEVAGGIAARGSQPAHAGYAFVLVFLGPSSLPRALIDGLPLADVVMRHPIAVHLATAACLAGPWWALERRSAPLYPESDEAHRVDRAAVQLVLVIVFELLLAVSGASLAALLRGGP